MEFDFNADGLNALHESEQEPIISVACDAAKKLKAWHIIQAASAIDNRTADTQRDYVQWAISDAIAVVVQEAGYDIGGLAIHVTLAE